MKKIVVLFVVLFGLIVNSRAEENYFYLDTPIEGIYTMMDKVTKVAANYVKPVRMVGSNEYVYCVTPGIAINPDGNYQKISHNQWNTLNISKEKFEKIQLLSYYGFMYEDHTDLKWYAVTQYLIWQEVLPEGWSVYFTKTLRGAKTNDFDWMINELESLVASYYTNPKVNNLLEGNYKDSITIYDSAKVLHNYQSNSENVIINNDSVTIKPSNEDFNFSLEYKTDNKSSNLYVFDSAQWVISIGSPIKKTLNYKVTIPKGDLIINKSVGNSEELDIEYNPNLEGAQYRIFNDYYDEVFTTDENGVINAHNLNIDSYYIKEIVAPKNYELDDNIYSVEIKPNKINSVSVVDNLIIGKVNILKKYLNIDTNTYENESGAVFGILDSEDNLLISKETDTEGYTSFSLPIGKYIVSQLKGPSNYDLIKNEEIVVDGNTINLNYHNKPIAQPIITMDYKENSKIEEETKILPNRIMLPNPHTSDDIKHHLIVFSGSIIILFSFLLKKLSKKKEIEEK